MRASILLLSLSCTAAMALAQNAPQAKPAAATSQTSQRHVTVPAGTEVPLQLKSGIDTKNSKVGDGVYCQTTFPVIVDNVVAIPPGSYVKGEIVRLQRAGKIKGRAEMQFKFTSLIFPNGYTVDMPGTLHHDSGTSNADVDEEGRIKADSQKGKDVTTIGKATGAGAAGGAILLGSRTGVLGGAGIGALAGLATIFSTRGQDVRIEPGASFKMLLQVPLTVDVVPLDPNRASTEIVPRPTTNNRLPLPDAHKPK